MKAKITLTPKLLKRLMDGKPLHFKFAYMSEGIDPPVVIRDTVLVEVVIEEDIFTKFDRVFGKAWDKMLDKLDKLI